MLSLNDKELEAATRDGWDVIKYRETYLVNRATDNSENTLTAESHEEFLSWLQNYRGKLGEDYNSFPPKVHFKYYLHDDRDGFEESMKYALKQAGYKDNSRSFEKLISKMDRPFYEVTLNCELDTETGEVKVISSSL